MKYQSKEILAEDGSQHHIRVKKGQVGRYVFLPGDPFRTDWIAEHLDDAKLVAHNREHKTWTGYLDGEMVSVTSTGMGCPSTAIALEELIHCGADTFIRVGTCGRVCEESRDPKLEGVVITGAVRDEGTTIQYMPIEYPAIANRHIVQALVEACEESGHNFTEGITQSKDSFYGEHDPNSMPVYHQLNQREEAWERAGVMASEMECAALFVISDIRGVRAGGIMSYGPMTDEVIEVACNGMRKMIAYDRKNNG